MAMADVAEKITVVGIAGFKIRLVIAHTAVLVKLNRFHF
jgi:hypothetical protein